MTRARLLGLLVTLNATVGWALVELLGSAALAGVVGAALGQVAVQSWRLRGRAEERSATSRALREHRDPGPEWRQATTRAARETVRDTAGLSLLRALLVGLAGVCMVAAVLRDDPTIALPAVPLTVLGVLVPIRGRRLRARAERWLADPPYAGVTEEQP